MFLPYSTGSASWADLSAPSQDGWLKVISFELWTIIVESNFLLEPVLIVTSPSWTVGVMPVSGCEKMAVDVEADFDGQSHERDLAGVGRIDLGKTVFTLGKHGCEVDDCVFLAFHLRLELFVLLR